MIVSFKLIYDVNSCVKDIIISLFAVLLLVLSSSCASTKQTKYFQDIPDSGSLKLIARAVYVEPKIQVADILTIIVQTIDPSASNMINSGNVTNSSLPANAVMPNVLNTPLSNSNASIGYLVDAGGNITMPVLGKIKLAGLTTTEARQVIFNAADQFYKDPSVIVRFANFRVNVAGEVLRPGTYLMPSEKVSILDAISMAGDLTIYGKRENVLLIRENPDGTKTPYRINLKKSDFISSPYFYLKQNDYIYIEPGKGKAASTDVAQARNYAIIGSFLSVLIVLFSYLNK